MCKNRASVSDASQKRRGDKRRYCEAPLAEYNNQGGTLYSVIILFAIGRAFHSQRWFHENATTTQVTLSLEPRAKASATSSLAHAWGSLWREAPARRSSAVTKLVKPSLARMR
jgi:hypothetical protein